MPRILTLKLLGPFRVERPPGLKLITRKVEALVAVLALPAGRLRHRGELAELLWGSRDEGRARHSLRQALSCLRRSLGDAGIEALVEDRDSVGFDPLLVETDAARLTSIIEDGPPEALTELHELWRGEPMAGLDLREEAFEEWLRDQRVRLRERALEGFQHLLERQSIEEPSIAAIETARTILTLDPTHEETHCRLMELYAGRNQRNLALQQYRDCTAILRSELDIAPGAETRRLHEQLLRGPAAPAPAARSQRRSYGPPTVALRRFAAGDGIEESVAEVLGENLLAAMSRDRSISVLEQPADAGQAPHAPSYLLEGTIRRVGAGARVTVRLIDRASAACLWSEQCDLAPADLAAGDRGPARHLTATFRREIESAEARKARAGDGPALDPWGRYHLGLREMYRFSMPGLHAARRHFERAVALDPDFAAAFARLAYVYLQMYWYGPHEERPQHLESGLAAARQAVGLDPKSAPGHLALGRLGAIKGDFDHAFRALDTAIGFDDSFAQAYFALGQASAAAGDPAAALAPLDRAIALDPHDPHLWTFYHDRAEACFALGRLAEAERFSRFAVGLPNASHFAHATLVAVMGASGKCGDAASAVARLRQIKPDYALAAAAEELGHHANRPFVDAYLTGLSRAGIAARDLRIGTCPPGAGSFDGQTRA